MTAVAEQVAPSVLFETPGGRLEFAAGDLDFWARHLAWCYEMLGVSGGATIAIQDFGTSPLAYLGSRLLMPSLDAGVAELLEGKVICLDASNERVAITPDVLRQVDPDVLVTRADVFGLLLETAQRRGVRLAAEDGARPLVIVSVGVDSAPLPGGAWRRLLCDEPSLTLAPECAHCGAFHLREGVYEAGDGVLRNLAHATASDLRLDRLRIVDDACEHGAGDLLARSGSPRTGGAR